MRLLLALSFVVSLFLSQALLAEVRLPAVISDHMLLQRDQPARIWGWAAPGEKIVVSIAGESAVAAADTDGRWQVKLPALKAGGPYTMTVQGVNRVVVNDVLFGEVWFCSGQSNMAMGVVKAHQADREIAAADFPKIRLLTVPEARSEQPREDAKVKWLVCSPRTVSYFSATAYFFGRSLHQELDVPVGLVVSAVNGTRIEPWTAGVGISAVEALKEIDKPVNGDLYNAMIHPLTPMTLRGAIWYQGEGNVGDPSVRYYRRMQALIGGWRQAWGLGDFPFYYVQIAPLNWGGKPKDIHAEVWEAQAMALRIPNTGMAVTTDIGHIGDAHPKNKQEVGRRLALWALAKTYGRSKLAFSGPIFQGMAVQGERVRLHFHHAEGLTSRDGKPLTWFTIAGSDGKFVPALAQIEGESVVVSAAGIAEPKSVRFGWHQNAEPNLMNKHGLPASPFRTDAPDFGDPAQLPRKKDANHALR